MASIAPVPPPMNILIADDHPLYREALRLQLERLFPGAKVTEAGSLEEAAAAAGKQPSAWHLILLDYHMPGMSLEGLSQLVAGLPDTPVAVVSGTESGQDVRAVIRAGARGFVPKTASGSHLQHTIQILLAGGTSAPTDMMLSSDPEPAPASNAGAEALLGKLTSREVEVLRSLVHGKSNKEIARDLKLAEVTVKLHLSSIFRKIGARSRAEAAVIASKAAL